MQSPSIKRSTSSENSGNTLLEVDEFDAITPPKNTNASTAMQSPSLSNSHGSPSRERSNSNNDDKMPMLRSKRLLSLNSSLRRNLAAPIKGSTSSENSGNTKLKIDEFGNKAYDAITPPKNTNASTAMQSPSLHTSKGNVANSKILSKSSLDIKESARKRSKIAESPQNECIVINSSDDDCDKNDELVYRKSMNSEVDTNEGSDKSYYTVYSSLTSNSEQMKDHKCDSDVQKLPYTINTNLVDHNHPIKTKECNPNDCKFTIAVKAIRIGIRKWPSEIPITISSEKITITIEDLDLKYPVDIPNEDIIECKAALDLPYLIMRTSQKIAKEINEKLLLYDDQQDSWLYDPVSTASYKKYIWIESQSSHDFNK
ncbi:hypothetical protein TrispH2_011697, partial [Trichoplax sp. H2]